MFSLNAVVTRLKIIRSLIDSNSRQAFVCVNLSYLLTVVCCSILYFLGRDVDGDNT